MSDFVYQEPFPLGPETTRYRLLTNEHVSIAPFDGVEVLKVAPEALTFLARQALRDVSFLLRPAHLEKVAAILHDPEASPNDRGVALAMLRNAEVSSKFVLPFCQDTGTATVIGKKGQRDDHDHRGLPRDRAAYRQTDRAEESRVVHHWF